MSKIEPDVSGGVNKADFSRRKSFFLGLTE
jgi:hypothetical protein